MWPYIWKKRTRFGDSSGSLPGRDTLAQIFSVKIIDHGSVQDLNFGAKSNLDSLSSSLAREHACTQAYPVIIDERNEYWP